MSKTISIINGSNILGRSFLKTLNGYNKIIIGDIYNKRKSLILSIKNMRENDSSISIEHINIHNELLLEEAIKNSNDVVYFTHDYFSLVEDKNKQLIQTAKICKAYNIENFIAVNPIEFLNFYSDNELSYDPFEEEKVAQEKAQNYYDKLIILRPNLIFGTKSYIVRFLTQHWIENFTYFNNIEFYKHYRFNPLYSNDLNDVINLLLNDESNEFRGKRMSVHGNESYSFTDIDQMIRQTYATKKDHKELNGKILKLLSSWQIFFHGNTHITNIFYMLSFMQNRNPQLIDFPNAMRELNIKPTSFREYYTNKAEKYKHNQDILSTIREEDLRFPRVQRYWSISLD